MTHPRRGALRRVFLGAAALAAVAAVPGEAPLEDLLQILTFDREVLAIDARSGGETREPLQLGETALSQASRGEVGVVVTNRRILAVGASSAGWQSAPYRQRERLSEDPILGDRVALVLTTRRIIGFDGGSGNLVESDLGVRERIVAREADGNVAIVVTGRRALGLSPFRGGFFETPLHLSERVAAVEASANVATVRTERRVLTFRAPGGSWSERRLGLRP